MSEADAVRVRVPASSANLGPGFDSLAAALAVHTEVEVVHTGRFAVRTDLRISRDRRNLVVRGFERILPSEGYEFRIASDIPLSGGLGTSAAAYVAGLLAADAIAGGGDRDLLRLATELEGHPDNVAAALLGGFVVCADGRAARFDAPAELEGVLVVPHAAVRTAQARAALPAQVPLADAARNVAWAATLVVGLTSGDLGLVARGLHDTLHQPWRASLYPRSAQLVEDAVGLGALGATISGAGPTVLLWTEAGSTAVVQRRLQDRTDGWAAVLRAPFERDGAVVI